MQRLSSVRSQLTIDRAGGRQRGTIANKFNVFDRRQADKDMADRAQRHHDQQRRRRASAPPADQALFVLSGCCCCYATADIVTQLIALRVVVFVARLEKIAMFVNPFLVLKNKVRSYSTSAFAGRKLRELS